MQALLFIRRGQCSQPNFKRNVLVGRHLYNSHVVVFLSYSKHVEFCELLHLLSKSDLHCCVSYDFFFPLILSTAMESSSVFMCFPCYQEFNTLEEVLKHQLTCTAEDEQPNTSGTTPVTVPVLQTQVNTGTVDIISPSCHVIVPGCFESKNRTGGKKHWYCDGGPEISQLRDGIKASESYLENDIEMTSITLVINWRCFATHHSNSDLHQSTHQNIELFVMIYWLILRCCCVVIYLI